MTTAVRTRDPLSTLAMPAAQNPPRRASARNNDAPPLDDGAPPAKKAKTDARGHAPAARSAAAKGASGSEQNEGGFTFKKKTKTTNMPPPAEKPKHQPQPDAQTTDRIATSAASAPRGRKRKSGSMDGGPAPVVEPRRRSKRLSGEKTPDELDAPSQPARPKTPEQQEEPRRRGRKPASKGDDGIHVERKRGPLKIALPFADTPVIQRNKEMRQTSSESRRRSSSLMRGRRASSLMDSGTSNALPHDSVEIADFYKHISTDMPEPRRMRQLMTWCGARALPARPGAAANGEDVNAVLAARTIQEELLNDIANKPELTDWSNRPDEITPVVLVKKPNPRNQANAAKLKELEAELAKLEHEKATWATLLDGLSTALSTAEPTIPPAPKPTSTDPPTTAAALADPTQAAHLSLLTPPAQEAPRTAATRRLESATAGLEFAVDALAAGAHRATQLERALSGTTDAVLADANTALAERGAREDGAAPVGVGELLRAFSRAGS